MGRKANVLGKDQLKKNSINNIISNVVRYDCEVKGKSEATRDTLKVDALVKTLIGISEESFKSKGSISNKLLDAILDGNDQVVNKVNNALTSISGYICDNLQDLVYYLIWFATTDNDPEYSTFEEFVANYNK